jgi:hypothetical protein
MINDVKEPLYRASNYYPGIRFTVIRSYTTIMNHEVGTVSLNPQNNGYKTNVVNNLEHII